MKPRTQSTRSSNWLGLCTITFCALSAGHALAQNTWDGGGSSGLWSLNTNWAGDVLPVPATATIYNLGGNVQNTLNNDLAGVTASSLAFTNNGLTTNTNAFTLGGNAITLTTQINAVATTAIGVGGTTITDTISAPLVGAGIRQFNIGLGHDLIFSGGLSGTSGSLSKGGLGTLTLSGTGSTYTGLTYVDSGILKLGANDMLPGTTLEIKRGNNTTDSNPIFDIAGFSDTIGAINFGHSTSTATQSGGTQSIINTGASTAVLTLGGNVTYRAGSASFENGQATISANLATGNANRIVNVGDGAAPNDLVISGAISGSGTLTKQGTGTLLLSGANTHTGNLNIQQGTVKLGASGVLPDANILQLGVNGTTTSVVFDINGQSETVGNIDFNGAATLSAATAGLTHSIIDSTGGGVLTLGGAFAVQVSSNANKPGTGTISANINTGNAARNLTINDSTASAAVDLLISGQIVGSNGFVKQGTGTLALSGANTYSGLTTPNAGLILVQNALAFQNSPMITTGTGQLTLDTGITALTTGGLRNGRDLSSVITNYSSLAALTLNPSAISASTYDNVIGEGATGMTLTKSGGGTQTLSATNTYTGATNVNAGKLVVTGAITSSAFTVSNAGTVLASDAAAAIGSGLTINNGAILAPGDAAADGTITVGATGTTFNNGSIFSWDINAAGTSYDKLVTASVAGEVAAGDAVFRIVAADSSFSDSFWLSNQSWTDVITTNGASAISNWATHFGNTVSIVNSSFAPITPAGGTFTLSGSTLTWTAVPEPTTALAGLLLTAGLLSRRRAIPKISSRA